MERKNRYLLEHILLSVTIELPGEINKKKILVPYDQFYKTTFSNRKIDATIDRPPESESEPESVTKQGKITESELPTALRKKKGHVLNIPCLPMTLFLAYPYHSRTSPQMYLLSLFPPVYMKLYLNMSRKKLSWRRWKR